MSFDDKHRASHGLTINSGIRNLLGGPFVLCSREGEVIKTIAPDYEAAKVSRDPGESREMFGMPVDVFSVPNHVSLPCADGEPIIVALVVAEAMRFLGKKRAGPTFSPMPLVMREGVALGSPGLIYHADLPRRSALGGVMEAPNRGPHCVACGAPEPLPRPPGWGGVVGLGNHCPPCNASHLERELKTARTFLPTPPRRGFIKPRRR